MPFGKPERSSPPRELSKGEVDYYKTQAMRRIYIAMGFSITGELEKEIEKIPLQDPDEPVVRFPMIQGVTPKKALMVLIALNFRLDGDITDPKHLDDPDNAIVHNDRDPEQGTYEAVFASSIDADPFYRNHSAKELYDMKVPCITFAERCIFGAMYHIWNHSVINYHLDPRVATICAGSRTKNGDTIVMSFYNSPSILDLGVLGYTVGIHKLPADKKGPGCSTRAFII